MRMEAKVTDEPTARVAGAEVGQLHTLPASKWHEEPSGHHLRIDAMGAESPADLELLVVGGEEVVVKCGSAARTHVALPPGADAGGVWGDLQAGALDIHVPAKKGG